MGTPTTSRFWPREHGAYVQLAAPLFAVLVAQRTPATWGWTVAALAGFLAHEPLLVLLGRRGARRQAAEQDRARVHFAARATVALGAALFALFAEPAAAVWALIPLCLAIAVAVLVAADEEKSLPGELVLAITLPAAALPAAAAAGTSAALDTWLGWSLGFAAMNVAVRSLLPRTEPAVVTWLLLVAIGAALGALALGGRRIGATALLPVAAALLVLARPSTRRLRRVGFGFTGVALVVALALQTTIR